MCVCGGGGAALPSSPRARPDPFVCTPRVHRPAARCGWGVPLEQHVYPPLPFLICSICVLARARGTSQFYAMRLYENSEQYFIRRWGGNEAGGCVGDRGW